VFVDAAREALEAFGTGRRKSSPGSLTVRDEALRRAVKERVAEIVRG